MRLLLDAALSTDGIGRKLAASGHDVGGLDREPALDGLSDEEVLELAARDGSILVTANTLDYPSILREWLASGRSHAGVILLHGVAPAEAAKAAAAVEKHLAEHPRQIEWVDRAAVV